MNEFNNRIDAQRDILNMVNNGPQKEELYGLSAGAIERWIRVNGIDPHSQLPQAVRESAGKLFFLANRSQEQVTDEYRMASEEIRALSERIARIVGAGP